jgi:hypothetical protein
MRVLFHRHAQQNTQSTFLVCILYLKACLHNWVFIKSYWDHTFSWKIVSFQTWYFFINFFNKISCFHPFVFIAHYQMFVCIVHTWIILGFCLSGMMPLQVLMNFKCYFFFDSFGVTNLSRNIASHTRGVTSFFLIIELLEPCVMKHNSDSTDRISLAHNQWLLERLGWIPLLLPST